MLQLRPQRLRRNELNRSKLHKGLKMKRILLLS